MLRFLENAHPHPAAALTSATSSPCSMPQVETMVSVFGTPGVLLSSDNPWDTDCLILPEPNCGRDKERVKDIPAPCSRHLSSGEQEILLWHPAIAKKGQSQARDTWLGGGTRTKTCSSPPELIPPSPAHGRTQPKSSPHFILCLSCSPVMEMWPLMTCTH